MDILNLGGINEPSEQPSKKKLKVIIGIGLLAGVMGMGSTLAASITLNGGTSVEFGQGVQYVTACDTSVTLTPTSSFVNGPAGSSRDQSNFALTSLSVSGIDNSVCVGKKFTINAYTDSATVGGSYTSDGTIATALGFGESYTAAAANFYSGTYVGTAVNTGCIITVETLNDYTLTDCNRQFAGSSILISDNTGGFTLTFARSTVVNGSYTRPILAAAVDKFSVESSA